jgi:hypothetical protein
MSRSSFTETAKILYNIFCKKSSKKSRNLAAIIKILSKICNDHRREQDNGDYEGELF